MKLPVRRWRIVIGTLLAALVAAGALVAILVSSGSNSSPGGPERDAAIPVGRAVTLAAQVMTPGGAGPHPLVVMPASWGAMATEYHLVGERFAARGYVVVAYAQRGFRGSSGVVDLAGRATQRDASRVIDWALAHTPADPQRIGMAGVSYGAGISLLAAERDPRIKAVVAMSAWTDLAASFDQNDTLGRAALHSLLASVQRNGRPSRYLTQIQQQLSTDPTATGELLREHAAERSPMTDVAALNRNDTAVMIANGWQDSLFAPAQLVTFMDALTSPKRLQLAVGDHGGPERDGLAGRPDKTIDDALSWFDHYLLGRANGIDRADPIQLEDASTRTWQGYASWPDAAVSADLGAPGAPGSAALRAPASWTASLTSGIDSGATSGPGQFGPAENYRAPSANLGAIDASDRALVWSGSALTSARTVAGSATVRFSIASSSPTATVFTYLYDVAPSGIGRLMSVTPYTATELGASSARSVSVRLQPTCWTIARGDHLALVVDTVDPRYAAPPPGSAVTLASTTTAPASISVPVA